jgi:hypothetical protein
MKKITILLCILFVLHNCIAQVNNDVAKITLKLSVDKIFVGGTVLLTGESGQLNTIKTVKVKVKGPKTIKEEKLDLIDGKYEIKWTSFVEGQFIITAFSSDNKDSITKKLDVVALTNLATMASKNIEVVKKAEKKLEEAIENTLKDLSNEDAAKLKGKFNETKNKIKALQKFYASANDAGKQFAINATPAEKTKDFMESISRFVDRLKEDEDHISKFINNKHTPTANTVCEELVIINEAAAAFSTASNIATFPISAIGIIKNIAIDKAVPYSTEAATAGANKNVSPTEANATKAGSKFFATAAADGTSLVAQMGTFGFLGDMVSYISDILLKKYCGIIKAKVEHTQTNDFNNSSGEAWWKYSFKTESVMFLRYPKSAGQGNIVKMKGNIEGNATDFKFFSDANKNDDFKKDSKGRNFGKNTFFKKPIFVPFATSANDVLGFGAAARAVVTPAYFNIPIDAEYNRNTNTLKLFMNEALIDFSSMVATRVFYFEFIPFPFVFVQAYPYEKVYNSMNAVIKRSKGIKVKDDGNGGLSFADTDSFHVGQGSSIEIDVKLVIKGKQEN